MSNGKRSNGTRATLAATAAALILAATPAIAQTTPSPQASAEVAVAIIDSNIRRIDFEDPNVRIVDMTPKAPDGSSFMNYKVTDAYSHGDIVASSFVKEYRKLDATSPIVIYVVDPFVRKDGNASANFSMRIMNEALPKMREAGVRVAITAFGISDAAAGQRIAAAFTKNDMALFAAVPNEPNDKGIYPAAVPGVISVASEKKDGAFEHDRSMSAWVTFSIDGRHGSAHNLSDADGTSFSVAHAGAYGAFLMKNRPETPLASLASGISSYGTRIPGTIGGREKVTYRIGRQDMIRAIVDDMAPVRTQAVLAKGPDVPQIVIASGTNRSNSR